MKNKDLLKKTITVTLGMTMALGTLALPAGVINGGFTTANAYDTYVKDTLFYYRLTDRTGVNTAVIEGAVLKEGEDTVDIPPVIIHEGEAYVVTDMAAGFMKDNKQVKTVIIPDTVTYIGQNALKGSSVEKIVMSSRIEHLGGSFAENCSSLATVECTGTNLSVREIGYGIFSCCPKLKNEKGAVTLGNWLIKYTPSSYDDTEMRIADLGSDGVKIDSIAQNAIWDFENLTTLDLEGIKVIGQSNFVRSYSIENIINTDSLEYIDGSVFKSTPWYEETVKSNTVRLGSVLIYHHTDDNILDLTSGDLAGIKNVSSGGLKDCINLDTIKCSSDTLFGGGCFNKIYEPEAVYEIMLSKPTYNIKKVYLDGRELTNSLIAEDKAAAEWVRYNGYYLAGAAFMNELTEDKTKRVFEQMGISYYGLDNDVTGTLSPSEEFYIRLKIHNYMSAYDYDHEYEYSDGTLAFLLGGKLGCETYACLTQHLLECAGVRSRIYCGKDHCFNATQIGDEWFENDDGWNAQNNNHGFSWFGLSTERITNADPNCHVFIKGYEHAIGGKECEHIIAPRTIGDTNGDTKRDKADASLLWEYIKGETDTIYEDGADVNFDGTIDVTDAVLLDQFVSSKAVDLDNVAKLGYAPTVKVAFLNGTDYDNIKYLFTDNEGYIILPTDLFEAPEGMKLSYDIGRAGEKVRITQPLKVVQTKWVDPNAPEYDLGDVNGDEVIDIEDAVAVIQHINGMTPLKADEEERADVTKDKTIDIDDAVTLISYINGNSTF